MSQREPIAYVWDVRHACDRIRHFVDGMDRGTYLSDERTRLAVERLLITIGEAVNRLSASDSAMAEQLGNVSRIVAFRNILVHGYFNLDHEIVWDTIMAHLPALHAAADAIWARHAHLYEEDPPSS